MGRRSTREEALKAEDQAVRLAARGLNDREIGLALGLSESEARRKRQLGLERRREEQAAAGAWERVDAELAEALRTAYRDHDDAPAGSAARVGSMKVVIELIARRARLNGIEIERAGLGSASGDNGSSDDQRRPEWFEFESAVRETEERIRKEGRTVIELERSAGAENVRPPKEEARFTNGETET